ncbi:hypothetical protein JDV02_007508 [Purpureocillium takamizusanense]|uniref:L-dopachrome isomerase n=1 Tax=Purpureocillium takamizusanense TaxID=2060973 RepID=A0A9Q8VE74_9HYPO|nr:uncharacterized protein JDV02_007508 [Purpureocillium takamizusanense]UNI21527.1 hypothetical protein JDV02_007508 [Purpureocillium takamizusanense]
MMRTGTPVHSRSASPVVMSVPLSRKPLPRNPPARPPPPPSIPLMERRIGTDVSRPTLEPLMEREANMFIAAPRMPQPGDTTGLARQTPPQAHKSSALPKDQIRAQAIVLAEVRTNVMVTNEYTFITELSTHLSIRYGRPVTSIVVTLQHSICMLFGGSFEPAYTVTVSALPGQMQMTSNKRNVALLQAHLFQALRVPPKRGFVRFAPVTDECSGWGGKTVAGQIGEVMGTAVKAPATRDPGNEAGRGAFKLRGKTSRPADSAAASRSGTPVPPGGRQGVPKESSSGPASKPAEPTGTTAATKEKAEEKRSFVDKVFRRNRK